MNVFPNPALRGGNFKIVLSENINLQTFRIFIYSVHGALITTINNPLYMNEMNVDSRYSAGVYHVVLHDNKTNRRSVVNFIVN